jgi:hypothetical protein
LIARYDLHHLVRRGRRRDVRQNLDYLELLLTGFERGGVSLPAGQVDAVDVGVADWFYAPALYAALGRWRSERTRRVDLRGFEVDPGRRYLDGHTREDWATWYVEGLPGARFVGDDGSAWRGSVDLALMLFPFLFTRDLDRWGLPRRLHNPAALLGHVWSRVRPGGALVIANQGTRERDQQRRLIEELGASPAWSGRVESPFWRYDVERFLHVSIKRAR